MNSAHIIAENLHTESTLLLRRCRARALVSLQHTEGWAILLIGGWGVWAVVSVTLGWVPDANPLYGVWGAIFAVQGGIGAACVLGGWRRVAHWSMLIGFLLCAFLGVYYLGWAWQEGRPVLVGNAWIFLCVAGLKAVAFRQSLQVRHAAGD